MDAQPFHARRKRAVGGSVLETHDSSGKQETDEMMKMKIGRHYTGLPFLSALSVVFNIQEIFM